MDHQQFILDNLTRILNETDKAKAQELLDLVASSNTTFIGGAGRSLLVSRFFAMRLMHAGNSVYMVGEVVTPAIKEGDLLIIVSGSGGTKTLLPFVEKAQDDSFPLTKGMPMGSQFELSTLVFLEGAISKLVHDKDLTEEGMRALHANLE